MTENNFSAIWSAVAPALGNHLWQSTLFAAIAGLLALLLRKNHARVRYGLWLAASLKFLVPFSLIVALGSHWASPRKPAATNTGFYWAMEQVSQPFTQPAAQVQSDFANVARASTAMLPQILVAAWLCGLVVVFLVWLVRWRRISTIMSEAEPLFHGRELEALRRLESIAGLKKPLPLLKSRASLEPGIFGVFRPVLLWPEGISARLEDAQLEAIVAHELFHVRRRDNLAATLHMLVETIFWFHPLVWWMGTRLVEERERACDEEVLRLGNQRNVYAESILKTCEFCIEAPLACVSGVTGANLKHRITRIMTQGLGIKLSFTRKILLAAIAAAALASPFTLGLLRGPQVLAQSPNTADLPALKFDVVSIKPQRNGDGMVKIFFVPDGLTVSGATAKMLVGIAYNVKDFQISGGPDWASADRFDIDAKMDDATIAALQKLSPEERLQERRLMLQALLEERFQFKLSHSTKELPIYELVVAKNGPKFSQSTTTPPGATAAAMQGRFKAAPGELTVSGMQIRAFADWLARVLGRVIVDKTGLTGNYDLTLHWSPESLSPIGSGEANSGPDAPPTDESGLSIFTAIQEQLGLKLEAKKGPVDALIIDSIQKPSEN